MSLFDLFNKLPKLIEITGSFGEWLAKYYSKIMLDALVLYDVLIDGADGYTSQIDLLLIGTKGIYVVEMKMYSDAKVYGDANKSKWYYYNHGKKYEIYSPLKQNKKHVDYLKELLGDFGDVPCFSVVTMICESYKITGKINEENNINTAICNSLPMMEKAIKAIAKDKPVVFDDVKKQEIFDYIQAHQYVGKEARAEHKQNVIAYKDSLEEMKKQKICPYCKKELVLRKGKYGEFYGCPNYPKCKYTLKL